MERNPFLPLACSQFFNLVLRQHYIQLELLSVSLFFRIPTSGFVYLLLYKVQILRIENYAKIMILSKQAPVIHFCHNVLHLMLVRKADKSELTYLLKLVSRKVSYNWMKLLQFPYSKYIFRLCIQLTGSEQPVFCFKIGYCRYLKCY